MNVVTIDKRDGTQEEMSIDEFSRWMCLMEAFDFIEKKAEEMGKLDKIDQMLKPLAIEKYINERYPAMRYDVEIELEAGNL